MPFIPPEPNRPRQTSAARTQTFELEGDPSSLAPGIEQAGYSPGKVQKGAAVASVPYHLER